MTIKNIEKALNSKQKINQAKQNFTHTFKLVFSSGMLGLGIIFSYFSNWVKIPFFSQLSLTIDLSIIFIIPVIFLCSLAWALSNAAILSLLNFIWNGSNWIGIIFLLLVNLVTVLLFYLLYIIFNKTKIRNKKFKWLVIWVFVIILNTIIFTVLNGIIFTPLYWWWYANGQFPLNFIEVQKIYNSTNYLQIYLLGIPDYWSGIWSLYTIFNLIKFILTAIFSIPVLIFFQINPLTKIFFN